MSGAHNTFAGFGSGQSAQPFNTVADYENFIKRADGFVKWLASVEQSMAQGVKYDVVLPMPLAKNYSRNLKRMLLQAQKILSFIRPLKPCPTLFQLMKSNS